MNFVFRVGREVHEIMGKRPWFLRYYQQDRLLEGCERAPRKGEREDGGTGLRILETVQVSRKGSCLWVPSLIRNPYGPFLSLLKILNPG